MRIAEKHINIINQINSTRFSVFAFRTYPKIGFYRKGEIYPADVLDISLFLIASSFWNFFAFFFFASRVNVATGAYLPVLAVIILAGIISIAVAKSLRDQSFENVKNHFLFLQFKKVPSAKELILNSFKYSSKWIYAPLLLGCFGATIFVYDVIKSDSLTTENIDKRLVEIKNEVERSYDMEENDVNLRVQDAKVLRSFNKISIGQGKTSTDKANEIDSIRVSYSDIRDILNTEKQDLRLKRQESKPAGMLSDLVDYLGRLFIAFLVGCLLSLSIDVSGMRKVFCAFSVAYSRLWCSGMEYYIINNKKTEHNNEEKVNTNEHLNDEHFEHIEHELDTEIEQFNDNEDEKLNKLNKKQRQFYETFKEEHGNISSTSRRLNNMSRTTAYKRMKEIKAAGLLNGEFQSET
jgi:hypothetical protein